MDTNPIITPILKVRPRNSCGQYVILFIRGYNRKRKNDALPIHIKADTTFLKCLIDYFGNRPFVRGNLDTARLSWLFGSEVVPADENFSPDDYNAMLKIDFDAVKANYPELIQI